MEIIEGEKEVEGQKGPELDRKKVGKLGAGLLATQFN
jgi:hypothetical protein